jgi:hypothetical protein
MKGLHTSKKILVLLYIYMCVCVCDYVSLLSKTVEFK